MVVPEDVPLPFPPEPPLPEPPFVPDPPLPPDAPAVPLAEVEEVEDAAWALLVELPDAHPATRPLTMRAMNSKISRFISAVIQRSDRRQLLLTPGPD